uniref:Uncharacterized protein n=1 Tax=Arundo donax TaxID=35708 RepID=A0A0A9F7X1_ARUDO
MCAESVAFLEKYYYVADGEHEEHLRNLAAAATSSCLQRRGRRREVQEHHPLLPIAVIPDAPGEAPRRAAGGEHVGVEDPVCEAGAPRAPYEADGDDAIMGGGRRRAGAGCGRRRSWRG